MITCETELDLSWSKDCVISEISKTRDIPPNPAVNSPTNCVPLTQVTEATFQISSAKPYVLAVTLSLNDNIKLLENIK